MKIDSIQELKSTKNSNHDHKKIPARLTKDELNGVRQMYFYYYNFALSTSWPMNYCSSS